MQTWCPRHPLVIVTQIVCGLCVGEQVELAVRAMEPEKMARGVMRLPSVGRPDDAGAERGSTGPPADRMLRVNLATSADSLQRPIRIVTADGERPRVYITDTLFTRSTSTGDVLPLA